MNVLFTLLPCKVPWVLFHKMRFCSSSEYKCHYTAKCGILKQFVRLLVEKIILFMAM